MSNSKQLSVILHLFVMKNDSILGMKMTYDANDVESLENKYLMTDKVLRPKRGFFYFIKHVRYSYISGIIGHMRHFVPKVPDFPSSFRHLFRLSVTGGCS